MLSFWLQLGSTFATFNTIVFQLTTELTESWKNETVEVQVAGKPHSSRWEPRPVGFPTLSHQWPHTKFSLLVSVTCPVNSVTWLTKQGSQELSLWALGSGGLVFES